MTNNSFFLNKVRESSGVLIAILFGSLVIMLLVTGLLAQFFITLPGIDERASLLISAALQGLFVFMLPAYLTSRFASSQPMRWLQLTEPLRLKNVAGILIVYIIFLLAMNWLIEWNANLHLPESMASIEESLRKMEDSAEASTQILLGGNGFVNILTGIIVVGVLTGLAEELFFRGALQKIFINTSMGRSVAIWVTALIFSTFHFQFFGFFPRLLMGAFFGYLLVWTGSLWVPVFAHALNNSLVVLSSALFGLESDMNFFETFGKNETGLPFAAIVSFLFTLVFLLFYRNYFFGKSTLTRSLNGN